MLLEKKLFVLIDPFALLDVMKINLLQTRFRSVIQILEMFNLTKDTAVIP